MTLETRVQILEEAICISLSAHEAAHCVNAVIIGNGYGDNLSSSPG